MLHASARAAVPHRGTLRGRGTTSNLRVAEALARLADAARHARLFKASLRQGQPLHASAAPRGPGLERRPRARWRACASDRAADPHRHPRAGAGGRGGRRSPTCCRSPRSSAARPICSLAAGAHRQAGEREEGPVDGARGDGAARWRRCARRGAARSRVTERGTFFGYGDLVVDMRSFARLRAACGVPVVFDATHSVQQPGQGPGGASGGQREFMPPLLVAAAAAGADGVLPRDASRPRARAQRRAEHGAAGPACGNRRHSPWTSGSACAGSTVA